MSRWLWVRVGIMLSGLEKNDPAAKVLDFAIGSRVIKLERVSLRFRVSDLWYSVSTTLHLIILLLAYWTRKGIVMLCYGSVAGVW